jgi:hypothetical protein
MAHSTYLLSDLIVVFIVFIAFIAAFYFMAWHVMLCTSDVAVVYADVYVV